MSTIAYERKIQIELVKQLYLQIKFALWAESLAAIGLVLGLWQAENHFLLLSWLAFNLVFCGLIRHVMVFCFRRSFFLRKLDYDKAMFWLHLFTLGVIFSGISWGSAGSLLMLKGDLARQTFLVFLLIGVTAVANPLFSPYRHVYATFLLLSFSPFTVWLMLQGGIFIILGLLALTYSVIMLVTSFYSHSLLSNSLRLRFENSDLVESLSVTMKTLEKRSNELFHQANFDSLTGLPNRALVYDRISQALAYSHRFQLNMALLFIDLDRFKIINDTLGHAIGDSLLKAVAERLVKCVRENDTVAREGGDEFLIILTSFRHEDDVATIARKCLAVLNEPYLIEGNKITSSVSIGISFYPKDGQDSQVLIRNADVAMYRAKQLGRNNFQFFTEKMLQKELV